MNVEPFVVARCNQAARLYRPVESNAGGPGASTSAIGLREASCVIGPGDRVAIVGRSGSGKSTLLHLLAGLDEPTSGVVEWPALGPRDALRPRLVSMIFQGPSLLAPLTAAENVAFPLLLSGMEPEEALQRARRALDLVGLLANTESLPEELSGGQSQRVAVARCLAEESRLILADEPTGQLDRENAAHVVDLLVDAATELGASLVIATHDPDLSARLEHRWTMDDGVLQTSGSQ